MDKYLSTTLVRRVNNYLVGSTLSHVKKFLNRDLAFLINKYIFAKKFKLRKSKLHIIKPSDLMNLFVDFIEEIPELKGGITRSPFSIWDLLHDIQYNKSKFSPLFSRFIAVVYPFENIERGDL